MERTNLDLNYRNLTYAKNDYIYIGGDVLVENYTGRFLPFKS